MKLKERVGDFRVRELLVEGYLRSDGPHRVYRVTKRKLTSPEAARILAQEAGVEVGEVALAGWKDRQGIAIQHMSVPRGPLVRVQAPELRIEPVGFAAEALTSDASRGNAFELNVRECERRDLRVLRANLPLVREHGTINYFDDQRFGNLTHGQGWIVKDLVKGDVEGALFRLLASPSPRDDDRHRRFKRDLAAHWGDWKACREAAGRFGAHHSVFESLARSGDFREAFSHIATRLKLIHLFAWQSHLWNRAVCDLVRASVPPEERVPLECTEGPLVVYGTAPPVELLERTAFRLPGAGLDDVTDPVELELLEDVLAREGLAADQMRIEGLAGFQLKGEDRPLRILPRHLRVRPPAAEGRVGRTYSVRIRFELPRGAYATLVVKRLFGRSVTELEEDRKRAARRPQHQTRSGRGRRGARPGAGGREEGRERGRNKGRWDRSGKGSRPNRNGSRKGGRSR